MARKTDIKTLKDLALNAVISNVSSNLMINKMEIPETLKMTLRTEFYNEWSRKRFPSYNITLSPFVESLKARGIDARTLDQIMDDYMHRIELTQMIGYKKIDWEWFVQEIARLHSVSAGPLCHLQKTISIIALRSGKPVANCFWVRSILNMYSSMMRSSVLASMPPAFRDSAKGNREML